MTYSQGIYSIGTATQTVVAPTNDYATYLLKNLEPTSVEGAARDGHIYLVAQKFSITSGSSVSFSIMTGPTGAQLDFYEIISDTSLVYAELIEGATVVTTGPDVPAYNMNRNFSDTHSAVLKAATSVTGGTTISAEYVTASNQAGGAISSQKIHTLKPNTQYAMKFSDVGAKTTTVFFQLAFSERYNGYNNIWLGTVGNSYVLKAGEEMRFNLWPNEIINATSLINDTKLAVIRQE